jgi:hypothetical protein
MTAPTAFPDTLPIVVQAWLRQLLDPEMVELLRDADGRQVEVRLTANKGRVRRRPAVLLDTGPQEMIDPSES